MISAEYISNKLAKAQKALDEIAGDITDSDLPYVRAEVENIAKALSHLFDIQKTIYAHNPNLVPEYLQAETPYPEWNIEYGKLIIQNESLLSKNSPKEAIILTEEFIKSEPPELFIKMANEEIQRIVALFKL